jgi:hypothetical protein
MATRAGTPASRILTSTRSHRGMALVNEVMDVEDELGRLGMIS